MKTNTDPQDIHEKRAFHINGYLGLIVCILLAIGGIYLLVQAGLTDNILIGVVGGLILVVCYLLVSSLTIVQPNEAKAVILFGSYLGTIKDSGLFMTVPLTNKTTISLRVRNFNSPILKVNDKVGNPVEIAAVIVYRVVDTAKALYGVDDYEQFVEIQSESAIRHVASEFAYDSFEDEDEKTLRGNGSDVAKDLQTELQGRLNVAGVEIIDTRITHLAYATEIAGAMLQRQQASAVLSARKIIVKGATGMAEDAIKEIQNDMGDKLPEEEELQMINNLLVSIVSERGTQNVINTDTLSK